MTIEYARNVLGLAGANSTEFDPSTPHPVIDLMETQRDVTDMGGTMRLGAYVAELRARLAGGRGLRRHRRVRAPPPPLRVQPPVPGQVRGRAASPARASSPDGRLVEFIELTGHPFWVGTQAHPEFKSRPDRPAPLFRELIGAALARAEGRAPAPVRPRRRRRARVRVAVRVLTGPAWPASSKVREEEIAAGFRFTVGRGLRSGRPTAPSSSATSSTTPARWRSCPSTTTARSPSSASTAPRSTRDLLEIPAGMRDVDGRGRRHHRGPRAGEEVGLRAGRLELLAKFHNSPGFCDETVARVPGHRPRPRCPHDRQGIEEQHMTDRARPPRRRAGADRRRAHHRRQDASSACCALRAAGRASTRRRRRRVPLEVEEFLTWLAAEQGRSPNTLAAYRRDLRRYVALARRARQRPCSTSSEADVVDHVAALRAEGLAPASVARALVAVRSLHRFLPRRAASPTIPPPTSSSPACRGACPRR